MSEKQIKKNDPLDAACCSGKERDKTLRELAEARVRKGSDKFEDKIRSLSPEESCRLIHELEVHQVELEMQNIELQRIKDELEKSRAWYLDLYDLAPVGYFTLTDEGTIIEANLTVASLLGVRRNSLCKQPFSRFIYSGDQDIFYLHHKELFKNGKKQLFELRVKKKDDFVIWVRIETTLAYGEDSMLTCRAVMSDITDRKIMEEEKIKFNEQIMQNQRLESLGILAGGIAHNFNNLLSGIFGYIELAEKKSVNPDISRYLSEALNMSDRAKALTGQLLTFSRGGAPIKKNGYLFPLVKDSIQFALSGSNIVCRFDIDKDLRPCNFDASQISQVIDDVILNARQAMPEGGVVDIRANNVSLRRNEVAQLPEGQYVKISIKDSGIGMTPEVLSKIFDPFFTTKTSGHGLGLATGYSIIIRHGGTIIVRSKPGKGSTVHIYIPAVQDDVKLPEKDAVIEHSGSGSIIIMDDEECIRDSLSAMLMSMGYDVIHMEDGDEVLSYFSSKNNVPEKISGIFLDLLIPGGIGGKAAVSELRKLLPDIPVFAISGFTYDPVILDPQSHGFTASISKPFLMADLSGLLNKYITTAP